MDQGGHKVIKIYADSVLRLPPRASVVNAQTGISRQARRANGYGLN